MSASQVITGAARNLCKFYPSVNEAPLCYAEIVVSTCETDYVPKVSDLESGKIKVETEKTYVGKTIRFNADSSRLRSLGMYLLDTANEVDQLDPSMVDSDDIGERVFEMIPKNSELEDSSSILAAVIGSLRANSRMIRKEVLERIIEDALLTIPIAKQKAAAYEATLQEAEDAEDAETDA